MTVVGRIILLILILEVVFREGNCQLSSWDPDFDGRWWEAVCSHLCSNGPCIANCRRTKHIRELNEEAKADVRLICRDTNYVVLAHNPGFFVIERKEKYINSEDVTLNPAYVTNSTTEILSEHGLRSCTFRSHRISANGISMPEITEWIDTNTDDYHQPMNATNIVIESFEVGGHLPTPSWTVEINFTPSVDRPCYYEVRCQQDDGEYSEMILLTNAEDLKVTFECLPLAANFTLTIKSLTKRLRWGHLNDVKGTIATFSTPRCWKVWDPSTCVPKAVEGLNATATHKIGSIFDVHLTWDKPVDDDDDPSEYFIEIRPIGGRTEDRVSRTVGKDGGNVVLRNVTIHCQYDVYIRGRNGVGNGPTISKHFIAGLKRIDVPGNIRMPMLYLTGSILIMVIGSGIVAYGYYRLRKLRLDKSKTVDKFEMSQECLTITRVLGTGAFGIVKLGSLRVKMGNICYVAVKMLQDDSNENNRRNFIDEIKIMKAIDEHPNIVSLLGCNTTSPYPFLVVEYCSRGDLQSFLRKSLEDTSTFVTSQGMERCTVPILRAPSRKEILEANSRSLFTFGRGDNYVQAGSFTDGQDTNSDSEVVTMMHMLNFGRQIATGMEFLSSSRVVHRDLASRNILVCCNRTVKISDFGLSRAIYKENIYKQSGNGRMPLKWMAIESLTHQVYTTCSDVWSFGIVLWEIVTRGGYPYPGVPTIEILNWLQSGYRMERSGNCSIPLYNVMLSCWQWRPRNRPTFTILRHELEKLISMSKLCQNLCIFKHELWYCKYVENII